ncbi:hypothetical protein NYQ35_16060 [Curtobacterium flaccumfaciens pv. flaccumfaciens]|uniref:hypothetical protein n=1 Tax=Curtobacterium flaccumfaciens TaxID=2035 RepID=UPI00217E9B60|nr:hypothetical protein [Curtobacterium flaccumfaciens]MCS6570321.1 hypothetical protein [Curtobacterium flaccumfaciens pv. flaccumfaciens]MCS6585177.1 hypothetical protein [Curtobacterium flaccumfaciens pv. flaccumfaciens]
MPETTTETTTTETGSEVEGKQEQTFSQADVDKLVSKVRNEERRKASEKFADYDDLKTKADGAKTVEQQLADLQGQLSASNARALRSDIAAKHGISAEDRDLFLTGTDEDTLTAQATRLAARETDRKKNGNVAPREGGTKNTGDPKKDMREFTRNLFGDSD